MNIERIRLTQEGDGSVHDRMIAVDPCEDILQLQLCTALAPLLLAGPARVKDNDLHSNRVPFHDFGKSAGQPCL
jgi:hypothetical protein